MQQNQEAVFFRDGKAIDCFGPGRHMLTTQNIPLITRILTIPWEKSPFQASVYFFGKQTFLDQKWGTPQPIPLRDADFGGMVQLRANGKYSFRVVDSPLLLNTLVGTQGKYTTEQVSSFLRDVVVSRFRDLLASTGLGVFDLQAKGNQIEAGTKAKVADDFGKYGLELVDFIINAITPPDEVQEAINARSRIGAIGGLQAFTMYQAANSMAEMAKHGGGDMGAGAMGMGMGASFGMMFPGMLQQAMQGMQPGATTPGMQPPSGGPQSPPPRTPAPIMPPATAAAGTAAMSSTNRWSPIPSNWFAVSHNRRAGKFRKPVSSGKSSCPSDHCENKKLMRNLMPKIPKATRCWHSALFAARPAARMQWSF